MRFKGRMGLEHGLKQIDIVPLINVVFLLFVFSLFSSSFLLQPGVKVSLPKVVTGEVVKYGDLEIIVDREGAIYLNDRLISIKELKILLKQSAQKNASILIKADRRTSLEKITEIWDMARDSGVRQINIATNRQ